VFAFSAYGDTWRKQRRMVSQDFSPNLIPRYYALQEKEAATLVRNLLKDPTTLRDELQLYVLPIVWRGGGDPLKFDTCL
jgi:cytochrome P450